MNKKEKEEMEKKIREVADKIVREYQPEKIILFGSWAWGKPTKDSDVDLFVVKETDNILRTEMDIDGSVFPRPFPMDLIVYTPEKVNKWKRLKEPFICKIINQEKCFMRGSMEAVGLWIKKAEDDELNIKSILKHRDGTPSVVCFLSQQMAEKYLKSLLVFYKNELYKVHDLIELQEKLSDVAPGIKEFHGGFKLLNRFYIRTRYPADYPDFFWDDAEEAYAAAKKIKEFVLERMK